MPGRFLLTRKLGARYVGSRWAFFTVNNFKGNGIANLEFFKGHALQFLGMKEEVFRFALAGDESKTPFCQRFDSSLHMWLCSYVS